MNSNQSSSTRADRALTQLAAARVNPETRFGIAAMEALTAYSRPSIYRLCRDGKLPQPVAPGRWRGGDVLEYLANQRGKEEVSPA